MATELNTAEISIDEEIDQIANDIANEIEYELAEDSTESPDKPGSGATGSAPESGKVTKAATPKGKKLSKKKVKAGAETKGEGDDPSEIEVYEEEETDAEESAEEVAEESDLPTTKQEMIRSIFETMKDTDAEKLAGAYAKLMDDLLGEAVEEDEGDDSIEIPLSIERTVITSDDIDISEDLNAIFGENDLSEEFKSQVQTVFEAAVVAKINSELESMEASFGAKLQESEASILSTITEKVDSYLSYVVEEWIKDNELAIERGIKSEITEEFIGGLKQLFEDHYIDVPEEKVDVVDSLAERVDQLEQELNETVEKNIDLFSKVKGFQKDEILTSLSDELTDIESEKMKGLAEGVAFEDVDQYRTALGTIKENYFPRTVHGKTTTLDEEFEVSENGLAGTEEAPPNSTMAAYVSTLGRTVVENQ